MSEKKIYPIPQEVADILIEVENYSKLRDLYVKLPFGFKKAVKCGRIAEEKRSAFWRKAHELYPETKTKNLIANPSRTEVWEE